MNEEKNYLWKNKTLVEKFMQKAELDVDIPSLVSKALSEREILEEIRSACIKKLCDLEEELLNEGKKG